MEGTQERKLHSLPLGSATWRPLHTTEIMAPGFNPVFNQARPLLNTGSSLAQQRHEISKRLHPLPVPPT